MFRHVYAMLLFLGVLAPCALLYAQEDTIPSFDARVTVQSDRRVEVKKEGFASVSEYFRHLIREHRKTQLAEELRIEREEFAAGRGTVLTSLKTLRS
ncbi:MAG: hypothetical protein KBD24_01380 [Candidatus Pacebacteria bacterium]|nr:hypothetical protein [Candidatus Paceibacterota bacterium]